MFGNDAKTNMTFRIEFYINYGLKIHDSLFSYKLVNGYRAKNRIQSGRPVWKWYPGWGGW